MPNMILRIESPISAIDDINLFNFQFANSEEHPVNLFVELNCFLNFDLLDNLIDFLNDDFSSSYVLILKSYEFEKEEEPVINKNFELLATLDIVEETILMRNKLYFFGARVLNILDLDDL